MRLFSDKERSYTGPADHTEERYSYYDRSGRSDVGKVRAALETWFSFYPTDCQADLRRRFETDFDAGFFELLLHQFLIECGYDVTVHPPIAGTANTPDFGVTCGDRAFYMEATVARDESDEERARRRVKNLIFDKINEIDSPDFFVSLPRFEIAQGRQPSARNLKGFIRRLFREADYAELLSSLSAGGLAVLPRHQYRENGVLIDVELVPKSAKSRGKPGLRPIGMYPVVSRYIRVDRTLYTAINAKATRYGELDRPYIIAVNSLSEWDTEDDDILNALFGTEVYVWTPGQTGPIPSRKPDGAFIGPKGPQNTRISAVLIASLYPASIGTGRFSLYHHPWPKRPLDESWLPIRQALRKASRLQWSHGQALHRILGLAANWPK